MKKNKSTILVVDDDQTHRNMLKTLLAKWGYLIEEADDGQVAINLVEKKPYDLILMDIKMIKVSGLVALAEIKKINPAIPVIIMTAFSSVQTAVDALKNGAYDYLTKPFDCKRSINPIFHRFESRAIVGHLSTNRQRRRLTTAWSKLSLPQTARNHQYQGIPLTNFTRNI